MYRIDSQALRKVKSNTPSYDASMKDEPRVACIFRSTRTSGSDAEYDVWSAKIDVLVTSTPGYVSHLSIRDTTSREGVTISYFKSLASVDAWREQPVHRQAQQLGRERFYEEFTIEICEVARAYHWSKYDEPPFER